LPAPPAAPTQTANTYDIRSLAQTGYVESILGIGASQSGKTTTLDQLGRQYRADYGDRLRAYYITPVYRSKGDNDERLLFDWCDFVLRFPLLNETDAYTITSAYEQYERLLDEFLALESDRAHPKLFIADELTLHAQHAGINNKIDPLGNKAARSFFGKLVNAINANASGGKAEGIALWGIAPSGAVNSIGLNKAAMSTATAIFVGNLKHWNGGVYDGARRNGLAPTLPPDRALMAYCERHNLDRVISVSSGDWQPLTAYEVPRPVAVDPRAQLEKSFQSPGNFPHSPENFPHPGKISSGTVNPETQRESEFPPSEDAPENFQFTDFPTWENGFPGS
jgi:hypothetical protein